MTENFSVILCQTFPAAGLGASSNVRERCRFCIKYLYVRLRNPAKGFGVNPRPAPFKRPESVHAPWKSTPVVISIPNNERSLYLTHLRPPIPFRICSAANQCHSCRCTLKKNRLEKRKEKREGEKGTANNNRRKNKSGGEKALDIFRKNSSKR